jgi:hypothetical protein
MEAEAKLSAVRQRIRGALDRLEQEVALFVRDHPMLGYREIGKRFGVSAGYVSKAAKKHGISRVAGRKKGWSPGGKPVETGAAATT